MSWQDIADYLGLTIEPVSRTLTSLKSAAAIEVPTSRRIMLRYRVLRYRPALCRLNSQEAACRTAREGRDGKGSLCKSGM